MYRYIKISIDGWIDRWMDGYGTCASTRSIAAWLLTETEMYIIRIR